MKSPQPLRPHESLELLAHPQQTIHNQLKALAEALIRKYGESPGPVFSVLFRQPGRPKLYGQICIQHGPEGPFFARYDGDDRYTPVVQMTFEGLLQMTNSGFFERFEQAYAAYCASERERRPLDSAPIREAATRLDTQTQKLLDGENE